MSDIIWCAEIGSMHNGSKAMAFELIRAAKASGATIAKFQLGWTREAQEKYAGNYDERRYIDGWAEDLSKFCDFIGIEFMASIWSMSGLEVARGVDMKRYKIAHQMNDERLVAEIRLDGKRVFHSGWDIIATDEYPTYKLPSSLSHDDLFDGWYGYSSHMPGIADALIAVTRGAKFIEKHLTLDRTMDWPRDASFALLPSEFKQMVDLGNEISRLR